VDELITFGQVVLLVAGGFGLALLSQKLTDWVPIPAPGIFLVAAAVISAIFSGFADALTIRGVERVAVVALIVILFDGGMRVGWTRFRDAAAQIVSLGVLGTFATAALIAAAARYLFGFDWTTAGLLGAALAPTDPAVMFSVLGRREITGRTATILEGESGANDPVGIALMIGMIDFATHDDASFWTVVREFSVEMSVGLAVGVVGGLLLSPLLSRIRLSNPALYPLQTLAAAGVVYGTASVAHGSGFLAVFVAGILVGEAPLPHKGQIERFHTSLASLAEIVVFVALGLTVNVSDLGHQNVWLDGLLLAAILAFIARPLVIGALLVVSSLRRGERLFVMWGGLKGAVPILLAAFALLAEVDEATRIYGIVFVVVAFSVVLQGATIPYAATRLGIPMRVSD
jgi:cell volume regulation protein A